MLSPSFPNIIYLSLSYNMQVAIKWFSHLGVCPDAVYIC